MSSADKLCLVCGCCSLGKRPTADALGNPYLSFCIYSHIFDTLHGLKKVVSSVRLLVFLPVTPRAAHNTQQRPLNDSGRPTRVKNTNHNEIQEQITL